MNPALSARAGGLLGRSSAERRELESWLLAAFLSLGPATWLPGVPGGVFRGIAVALFLAAVGLVLHSAALSRSLRLPGGFLLGPWSFLALAALSIPGLAQTTSTFLIVDYFGDILRGALLLWCFFHLARRGDGQLQAVFRRTFLIVGALAAAALVMLAFELPEPSSPCYDMQRLKSAAGFNDVRTGWGIGLAHLLPCAIFLAPAGAREGSGSWPDLRTLARFAAALFIFGALFFSGSRSAMLMSLVALAGLFAVPSSRRLAAFLLVAGLAAGVAAALNKECAYQLRLDWMRYFVTDSILPVAQADDGRRPRRAAPQDADRPGYPIPQLGSVGQEVWNELSNYRLWGFIKGFEYLRERPLQGYGLRGVMLNVPSRVGKREEVHNLWLKWALYTGVLAPAWFLVMVAAIVRMTWRVVRDGDGGAAVALALMVAVGVAVTMFEPNALMGNFHRSASWWAAAGAIAGLYEARFRATPAAEGEGTRRT